MTSKQQKFTKNKSKTTKFCKYDAYVLLKTQKLAYLTSELNIKSNIMNVENLPEVFLSDTAISYKVSRLV